MSRRAGAVSTVRGRRQAPALRTITVAAWVLAGLGALTEERWSLLAGTLAIVLITATPLLRVGWLMIRWRQEDDWGFVWVAAGLLAVVGAGAAIVLLGG